MLGFSFCVVLFLKCAHVEHLDAIVSKTVNTVSQWALSACNQMKAMLAFYRAESKLGEENNFLINK